ncbi:MAG: HigA family addiction module antitoxin [Bryobacterales bacterium]|nr:HigA family addiction module antitoxin [Bryobacterales bacterium]
MEGSMAAMYDPSHPGEVVLEFCLDGTDPGAAAKRLGMPRAELDRLLAGKCPITPATALKLEAAGWSNASYWMRLQAAYDLAQARLRQERAA